ncbi:MAG: hypothetical protein AB1342_10930 [Pseudomonadota bacterium]
MNASSETIEGIGNDDQPNLSSAMVNFSRKRQRDSTNRRIF